VQTKWVHQDKKETSDMVKLWVPGAGSTQTRLAGFQDPDTTINAQL
jgi:hypothetical protein